MGLPEGRGREWDGEVVVAVAVAVAGYLSVTVNPATGGFDHR